MHILQRIYIAAAKIDCRKLNIAIFCGSESQFAFLGAHKWNRWWWWNSHVKALKWENFAIDLHPNLLLFSTYSVSQLLKMSFKGSRQNFCNITVQPHIPAISNHYILVLKLKSFGIFIPPFLYITKAFNFNDFLNTWEHSRERDIT